MRSGGGVTLRPSYRRLTVEREVHPPGTEAMQGKIAVEEHFAIDETTGNSVRYPGAYWAGLQGKLLDIHGARLAEMDQAGIETAVLSLNYNAIQGIPDVAEAVATARK